MQRYLEQLREDMQRASGAQRYHNGEHPHYRSDEERKVSERHEHFTKIDAYVGGVTRENFYDIIGFGAEQFPPADRLTGEQATQLAEDLLGLLECFRALAAVPSGVPPETVYPELLRAMHGDYLDPGPGGYQHLRLCECDPARCPWPPGYCNCQAMER